MGAFVIFNTFSITVAQRMREFAMLRTIGAMRRQVLLTVLGEALVVGVTASVLGLIAGVGFAKLLGALFKAVGLRAAAGRDQRAPVAGRRAAARGRHRRHAGGLVRAGAAGDARAADRGAARGRRAAADRASPASPRTSPALLLVLGILAVFLGVTGSGPTTQRLFTIAIGAILSFIGLAMVSRYLIRPLARAIGWPLGLRGGASGRLARENTTRNTGRTAVTAAALMIGIGLVVFFSVLINGFKQSFLGSIDKSVTSNLIIQNHSQGAAVPDAAVASVTAGVPGVGSATGIAFTNVRIDNGGTDVANGVDPQALPDALQVPVAEGRLRRPARQAHGHEHARRGAVREVAPPLARARRSR